MSFVTNLLTSGATTKTTGNATIQDENQLLAQREVKLVDAPTTL